MIFSSQNKANFVEECVVNMLSVSGCGTVLM